MLPVVIGLVVAGIAYAARGESDQSAKSKGEADKKPAETPDELLARGRAEALAERKAEDDLKAAKQIEIDSAVAEAIRRERRKSREAN